jgi:hypothetical protein
VRKRYWNLVLAISALALGSFAGSLVAYLFGRKGDFARAESIEIRPLEMEGAVPAPVQSTDRGAIRSLLQLIGTAKPAREHECAPVARVTISGKSGDIAILDILPGHDAGFYEFRRNHQIYRVPRPDFLVAMKKLGIENVPETPRGPWR